MTAGKTPELFDDEGARFDINKNLEKNSIIKAINEIRKFLRVFITHPAKSTIANLPLTIIKLRDKIPVQTLNPRFNNLKSSIIERKLARLEASGIIKQAKSPYKSSLFLQSKGDGGYRLSSYKLFVNYRNINQKINKEPDIVPRTESILLYLHNKKYFALLDLKAGFFQIPLAEGSKKFTGISFGGKDYVYNALPPGLNTSRNVLQTALNDVLDGLLNTKVIVYLEKICIFGETFEETLENTTAVLQRLDQVNFKLKTTKCKFFAESVEFLGFAVSPNKLGLTERNLLKIKRANTPTTTAELRSFLGSANFYRKFIKGYGDMEAILSDALRDSPGQKLELRPDELAAFERLKAVLMAHPEVAICDRHASKILETYLLPRAYAATLYQINSSTNEKEVVAYVSKKIKESEVTNEQNRLEWKAILSTCELYKSCVEGCEFLIYTKYLTQSDVDSFKTPLQAQTIDGLSFKIICQ